MPPRLAAPLVVVTLTAVLAAGCGGSSVESERSRTRSTQVPRQEAPIGAAARSCPTRATEAEGLRATGVSCDQARQVMLGWRRQGSCSSPSGASRVSCTTRSYRCLGARTDRGTAVSCSRPGRSIAFVAKR